MRKFNKRTYVHTGIINNLPTGLQIAVNSAHSEMMRQIFTQRMVGDFSPLAYKLVVHRSNLVHDTLNSLVSTDPANYKKPLRVRPLLRVMHMRAEG